MDGNERRQAISEYLKDKGAAVSGTELARQFGVSRQIIVQDIALLRAGNRNILSTNKGYLLYQPGDSKTGVTAVVRVRHSAGQTLEEMRSIIDYGGSMLDVFVDHDLYGQIRTDLVIRNMEDAEEFCAKMKNSQSKPLKVLTDDWHYHTITAPSQKALQLILQELAQKGFTESN